VLAAVAREEQVMPSLGLQPGAIQGVSFGQRSLWIVPGADGMCVTLDTEFDDPVTGTQEEIAPWHCDSTVGILSYGLVEDAGPGGTSIAFGLVPNGNTAVTAQLATGTLQRIPVTDNGFVAEVGSGVTSFQFAASGDITVSVPVASAPRRYQSMRSKRRR
jgi:hypothetical protein